MLHAYICNGWSNVDDFMIVTVLRVVNDAYICNNTKIVKNVYVVKLWSDTKTKLCSLITISQILKIVLQNLWSLWNCDFLILNFEDHSKTKVVLFDEWIFFQKRFISSRILSTIFSDEMRMMINSVSWQLSCTWLRRLSWMRNIFFKYFF